MGSMCSKSASLLGGRTVHDDPDEGNTPNGSRQTDPRAAAAEAAERRRKAEQSRGTQASNPNKGKLAANLEASKAAPRVPEPRQEEQLVVSTLLIVLGLAKPCDTNESYLYSQWD
ncbi:hypothetical protein IEO21_00192 [Rhodonia placenta]|uniref:Uncharacterized protein n=1 Tax=Rhodonia placenta TaxID=104341 RepID=A0A8H7PCH0_9APHY|nr:hypothetical protein IEO21_00192 [Postia placenta]